MLASIRFTSFSFKPTNQINSQRGPEEDNSSGSVSGKIHRLPALAERARTSSKVLVGRIPLSKPKKKKKKDIYKGRGEGGPSVYILPSVHATKPID